jgi:response regulator RpfG family c-di-GMP phosphodiesterase
MQLPKNRILCVDDNEDSNSMMKVLLEMWNYEVAMASTAADGFHLAQSERVNKHEELTRYQAPKIDPSTRVRKKSREIYNQ